MTTTPTELSTASAEALLDAMVALTHRIHAADKVGANCIDLRERRAMVRAELLRRVEAAS